MSLHVRLAGEDEDLQRFLFRRDGQAATERTKRKDGEHGFHDFDFTIHCFMTNVSCAGTTGTAMRSVRDSVDMVRFMGIGYH